MASHHHYHYQYHHHPPPHHQTPSPCTHCSCSCTTPPHHHPSPPPPPPHDHLLEAIASLLSQPHPIISSHHYPKSHTLLTPNYLQQQHHQTHSTISSLLQRIESLESSLNHLSHHTLPPSNSSHALRHAAARVIQTHFRSFLVRRSRTLRHLKHLAFIKSTFNSLKSSLSDDTRFDFAAISQKALNLLLQLDSIEDCDLMIVEGKRSISRDLVQFLDSIEGVFVKKHMHYVKSAKNARSGQRVNKSRDSGDDERRKMLQNLRGRVEKISRLCKVSANDEEEPEFEYMVGDDDGGASKVLVTGRNEVSPKKNGVFVQKHGVQPRVKKSVKFAENGKLYEVYGRNTYEPDLSGDVMTFMDGSSSDDQGEVVLENVSVAVEDGVDSSQGDGDDDDEAHVDNGGSPHTNDVGGRNSRRGLKLDGRNVVRGQLEAHQEELLFSAPLPLKMESKVDLSKSSKGVRIS